MDCDPTTASSGNKINFGLRKKVSWACNLEEIMYFCPDYEFQQFQEPGGKVATTNAMQKKLKKKPQALKNKRFASFLDIGVMDRISGRCGEVNFKDLMDSEKN
jgi:hypothetical protein